jgi:hypothetical protein
VVAAIGWPGRVGAVPAVAGELRRKHLARGDGGRWPAIQLGQLAAVQRVADGLAGLEVIERRDGAAIALLCQKGLGPPTVELYARNGEVGIGAGAAGRHSVVVSAGLLRSAQLGELPADQAAGVIAAAVGRIRLGQTRFDVAVEFWTIPWQLVREVCLAIAKTVGLLRLTQFAWRIRFVVAAVAVAQSVADGRIAEGLVVAAFIALTYLAPRWQRNWGMRSQNDSDRFVADHELGDALGRFLRRCPPEPRTLERIHRLTSPVIRPSLALIVSDPAPTGRA